MREQRAFKQYEHHAHGLERCNRGITLPGDINLPLAGLYSLGRQGLGSVNLIFAVTKISHDEPKMRGLEYHGKADGTT